MIIEDDNFGLNEIDDNEINITFLNKKKIFKLNNNTKNIINNKINNKNIFIKNNNYVHIKHIKKNDFINANNRCFKDIIK